MAGVAHGAGACGTSINKFLAISYISHLPSSSASFRRLIAERYTVPLILYPHIPLEKVTPPGKTSRLRILIHDVIRLAVPVRPISIFEARMATDSRADTVGEPEAVEPPARPKAQSKGTDAKREGEEASLVQGPGTSARVLVEVSFNGTVVTTFRFNGPPVDEGHVAEPQDGGGPTIIDAAKVTDGGFGGGADAGGLLVLDIGSGARAKTRIELRVYTDNAGNDSTERSGSDFGRLLGTVVLPWDSLKWLCASAPHSDYDVRWRPPTTHHPPPTTHHPPPNTHHPPPTTQHPPPYL